jgi:hypothetical protein
MYLFEYSNIISPKISQIMNPNNPLQNAHENRLREFPPEASALRRILIETWKAIDDLVKERMEIRAVRPNLPSEKIRNLMSSIRIRVVGATGAHYMMALTIAHEEASRYGLSVMLDEMSHSIIVETRESTDRRAEEMFPAKLLH